MDFNRSRLIIKVCLISLLLGLSTDISFSQVNRLKNLTLSHPLNYNPQKKARQMFRYSAAPETLYVYGIRVQFAEDNDPNTTGNGRFDLSNNYPDSIEAPPHDSAYFLDHMEFLKNYFGKVSKGKLFIRYQLLGNVRNLSNQMSYYSPGPTEGLNKLGKLFFDTWRSVDSIDSVFNGINPSKSAFVIFHAGVGRDVDLISQGIFQGQLDLPSLYLSNNSLKNIYGDTLNGYWTRTPGVVIPSSLIIPEGESRLLNTSFGTVYLELSMNGILAASIGSHLGLPDLFDTRTGLTAIGRFGLMDGQSIFSFSGVFPPEPSAWEKQYLGWVNPIVVNSNGNYITRAASLDMNGNSSVYKVLIDAKEYFLVENRNRDAKKNGQTVYFRRNGVPDSTIPFTSDQDGFQNGDVWKLKGNITDVDELDWSLPGIKNDTANYQGGILVWHIDENVIDANFASNTINTNIYHRGVDLEEAKGSQDIGVQISTPFGIFVGDGTPYDYWYNGNHYVPSNIYRNEFTPTSFPNSKSYSNFNSRVCLSNFSAIDSSMTFTFAQCGTITNINTFPRFVGIDTSGNAQPIGIDINGNDLHDIFVNVKDSLYGFKNNGTPIRSDVTNGFLIDSVSNYIVGYLNFQTGNGNKFITGVKHNAINLVNLQTDSLGGPPNVLTYSSSSLLNTPTLHLGTSNLLYAGTSDGRIAKLDLNSFTFSYDSVSNKKINELAAGLNSHYAFIDDNYKFFTLCRLDSNTAYDDTVIVTKDNKILVNRNVISANLGISNIYSSPIACDINKDGHQEIIFTADDKVFAINRYGTLIDNFPFKVTGVNKISSGCAVADVNGDGIWDIIFGTGDGRVYAYGVNGKVVDGFPLLTGKEVKCTPAIINYTGNFGLLVYSTDGYLYGWKMPATTYNPSKILWQNYLTDSYHSNSNYYRTWGGPAISGPCLPSDRVYNWPNPVYGGSTNIRYFLNGTASSVQVKIMDLAGELVTTINGTAHSGFDNEVAWDVSNVQSGIYIAVLQLQSGNCNETASIKIAVVK